MLLLWFLWLVLPSVVSDPDTCAISQNSSSLKVSPVLESLHCYNDYQSYFHCMWKEERHSSRRLKLWFKTNSGSSLCKNYSSAVDGTSQCWYKTKTFSIGTNYTAFFNETLSLCSSVQQNRLNLSLLLRAQPPVNLTTSRTKDGDTLIIWSSPYPKSSSLNSNIIYKLRFRPHRHNNWTTEELSATQKRLGKKMLISGHRYEAQVKARVSMGQWSHWTALVSWHSELDPEQVPRVDCVVWGEEEVQCSWEQTTELVHFISYQLVCRPNHTAPPKVCCNNPVVIPSHREDALRYSCLLSLTQSSTLPLLELIPTRNAKMFRASENILPYPPTQVNVTEEGRNWLVTWTPPKMNNDLKFDYVVYYYSKQDEEDSVLLDITGGSTTLTILGSSLLPSQSYKVKVRSRLVPPHKGMLSDWSIPAKWTSHTAVWPISNWIFVSVAVMVTLVFLTLYYTIPACRRRAILWVDSLPSPAKSKIMSDVQTLNICKVLPCENTYICKVLDMDRLSTCSSDAFLWPTKSSGQDAVEMDEGIWSCDNLPVTPVDTSSLSFSGPYILCQSVESKPVDDISDQTEVSCPDPGRPAPVNTGLFEEGYVCLPTHTVSRSIQDLTSQNQSSTSEQSNSSTEDQHCLDEDHNSKPFWPQGGAIQRSGYCQLPA